MIRFDLEKYVLKPFADLITRLQEKESSPFVTLTTIILLYTGVFLLVFPLLGPLTEALSFIPVIFISATMGTWYGAGASVLGYVMNSWFIYELSGSYTLEEVFFRPENVMGSFLVLFVSIFAGILRNYSIRLRREYMEKEKISEALKASEKRYALAARGANDGLWDWDLVAGEKFFSPRWKEMLGYAENEISNSPEECFSRIHPEDLHRVKHYIQALIGGTETILSIEHRILHKNQYYLWIVNRGVVTRDEAGRALRITGTITDISEKTVKDPLTGLPNRVLLLEYLDQEVRRNSEADNGSAFAVLSIDIDNFSLINNSLGPLTGDQLLCRIAERLTRCIRPFDSLGRLGGDEFIVILRNIRTPDDINGIVDRIRNEFCRPCLIQNQEIMISMGIGIARSSPNHRKGVDMLRDADIALSQAKRQGTGFSTLFRSTMHTTVVSRMALENDLHQAIRRGEFEMHYQPITELKTLRTVGTEALIRWNHPSLGLINPERFIPILEETGLIRQVGAWVLRTVCLQEAEWKKKGFHDLYVSVNLSPLQFSDKNLPSLLKQIMNETRIQPEDLVLEITETAILEHSDTVLETLTNLNALGLRISVDDFGTGYSTMGNIRHLPISTIKIDRSFIEGCVVSGKDRVIVTTMIELAKGLEIKVIAEGVETEKQLKLLEENGCDLIQGYYSSPPLAADEFFRWHLEHSILAGKS